MVAASNRDVWRCKDPVQRIRFFAWMSDVEQENFDPIQLQVIPTFPSTLAWRKVKSRPNPDLLFHLSCIIWIRAIVIQAIVLLSEFIASAQADFAQGISEEKCLYRFFDGEAKYHWWCKRSMRYKKRFQRAMSLPLVRPASPRLTYICTSKEKGKSVWQLTCNMNWITKSVGRLVS